MLNVVSCQETSKHIGSACDLENGIDDWCTSLRIETYFNDEINAFSGTVTNGGDAGRTKIVITRSGFPPGAAPAMSAAGMASLGAV